MSGSPSGSTRFDSGDSQGSPAPGGAGGGSACSSLSFQTPLNSPVPTVVSTLRKGSELTLRKSPAGAAIRIEAVTLADGQIAGTITSQHLPQLIGCMNAGFEYSAVVITEPSGGLINLLVRCKAP